MSLSLNKELAYLSLWFEILNIWFTIMLSGLGLSYDAAVASLVCAVDHGFEILIFSCRLIRLSGLGE